MNSSNAQHCLKVTVFLAPGVRLCFDFNGLRQLTDRCKQGYRLYLYADRHLACPCFGSDGATAKFPLDKASTTKFTIMV